MEKIISVEHIVKDFVIYEHKQGIKNSFKELISRDKKIVRAVDDISFEVNRGDIVGYLGTNGAGKSTTIKMMTGILKPTSGNIKVNGLSPNKDRVNLAKNIGVVFGQKCQLWWDIPLIESLNLTKYMYNISTDEYKKNLDKFIELLDMKDFINVPVRQLSLGQRIRGEICCALIHNPQILFLDEPTIGLDVVVKKNIRDFIHEINKEKDITVILTTHDMDDVEKLCNNIIIIDEGKKIFDNSIDVLKKEYADYGLITYYFALSFLSDFSSIKSMDGIQKIESQGNKVNVYFDKKKTNTTILSQKFFEFGNVVDFQTNNIELSAILRNIFDKNKE